MEVIKFYSPSTTAIPALQPIVHDLFVLRGSNKADAGKELDTQKEVVVSMLLRLVQHHQVQLQMDSKRYSILLSKYPSKSFLHLKFSFMCVLQVLEMFILVLQQCHKENEDKWKRLSRQIADVILPMIAKQQVGKCMQVYMLVMSQKFKSSCCTVRLNTVVHAASKHVYMLSSQMHLDSPEALGVLNTLFETVAPSSLRPVDMLLKSMFTTPVTMVRYLV